MTDKIYLDEATNDLKTLLDIVRWTVSRFNNAGLFYGHGTDNPWDEAVSLALHCLHLPADMLASNDDAQLLYSARLTHSEKERIAQLVIRRVRERLPLPYLTNQAWFCGLPFYVDERVLIPRSPFAELITSGFQPWLQQPVNQVLDMCCGGGCIAIALADAFTDCQVDAVDISDDALAVAELNIAEHDMAQRVFPIKSNLFAKLTGQQYDLIVSNPPYVDREDMADLPDEFQHEPELALAAGQDGLDLVEQILHQAPAHMTEAAWLFVEVGNSMVHMQQRFPSLEVEWVEFAQGGDGVFAISKQALDRYFEYKQNNLSQEEQH